MDHRLIKEKIRSDHPGGNHVTLDACGVLRAGHYHLVTARDGLHLNDIVPQVLIEQYFEQDFENCITRCLDYSVAFLIYPVELQCNLAALVYLTAGPRLWLKTLFYRINKSEHDAAIEQLQNSVWYTRNPPIVARLIETLKDLKGGKILWTLKA
jgi:hypothetical protein